MRQWPVWNVPLSLVSFASASFMPLSLPKELCGRYRVVTLGTSTQFPQVPCLLSGGLAYLPVGAVFTLHLAIAELVTQEKALSKIISGLSLLVLSS